MKHKIVFAALLLTVTSLSAPAFAGGAADAIDAAKKSQKEAKALGFEWRDMGKMIKKAEALAKEGKEDKAIKIAKKVAGQIDAIKKQAEAAKTAGPVF